MFGTSNLLKFIDSFVRNRSNITKQWKFYREFVPCKTTGFHSEMDGFSFPVRSRFFSLYILNANEFLCFQENGLLIFGSHATIFMRFIDPVQKCTQCPTERREGVTFYYSRSPRKIGFRPLPLKIRISFRNFKFPRIRISNFISGPNKFSLQAELEQLI